MVRAWDRAARTLAKAFAVSAGSFLAACADQAAKSAAPSLPRAPLNANRKRFQLSSSRSAFGARTSAPDRGQR